MGTRGRKTRIGARAAGAALAFVCLGAAAGAATAQGWSEFGPAEAEAPQAGLGIKEPFFAFLVAMVEADSCGEWDGRGIERSPQAAGRDSRFPLDDLVRVTRRRPVPSERDRWSGTPVRAVWSLEWSEDLDRPMPYDILGYHPGSLRVSRRLDLVELAPLLQRLHFQEKGKETNVPIQDVRIFALVSGKVLLDADAFIDKLLGPALDDAWTVGFVLAREEDRRLGLGVSLGRKGRKIFGEFDFMQDKVLPNGRPLASALSGFARQWLQPQDGRIPAPWIED